MPEKEIQLTSTTVSPEQEVKVDHTTWSGDFSLKDKDIATKLETYLSNNSLVNEFVTWLTKETKADKTKKLNESLSTWYKDIFVITDTDKSVTWNVQNWIEHLAKKEKDGAIHNYLRFVFWGALFTADIGTDLEKVGTEIQNIENTFRAMVKELVKNNIEKRLAENKLDKDLAPDIVITAEQVNLEQVRKTVTTLQTWTSAETTPTTPPAPAEEKKPWLLSRLWNRLENVFTGKEDPEKAVVETKKEVGNGLKRLIGIWTSFAWVFSLSKYFDKKDKDATGTATDSWKDMAAEIKWYFEKAKNWVDETFFDKKTEEVASSTTSTTTVAENPPTATEVATTDTEVATTDTEVAATATEVATTDTNEEDEASTDSEKTA